MGDSRLMPPPKPRPLGRRDIRCPDCGAALTWEPAHGVALSVEVDGQWVDLLDEPPVGKPLVGTCPRCFTVN